MSRLKEMYKNEIMDAMTKKFGYKNVMEVPKLDKIVINMGVGEAKENAKLLDAAIADMELVTDLRSMEGYQLIEHIVLENNDMKACNSAS
ncbi:50S ribosomal protein L5, partial [Anaerosalibacter bizertensis]|nr:50S ribosomal protein L5 [Anaerosalibacter bizertensis]